MSSYFHFMNLEKKFKTRKNVGSLHVPSNLLGSSFFLTHKSVKCNFIFQICILNKTINECNILLTIIILSKMLFKLTCVRKYYMYERVYN